MCSAPANPALICVRPSGENQSLAEPAESRCQRGQQVPVASRGPRTLCDDPTCGCSAGAVNTRGWHVSTWGWHRALFSDGAGGSRHLHCGHLRLVTCTAARHGASAAGLPRLRGALAVPEGPACQPGPADRPRLPGRVPVLCFYLRPLSVWPKNVLAAGSVQ